MHALNFMDVWIIIAVEFCLIPRPNTTRNSCSCILVPPLRTIFLCRRLWVFGAVNKPLSFSNPPPLLYRFWCYKCLPPCSHESTYIYIYNIYIWRTSSFSGHGESGTRDMLGMGIWFFRSQPTSSHPPHPVCSFLEILILNFLFSHICIEAILFYFVVESPPL